MRQCCTIWSVCATPHSRWRQARAASRNHAQQYGCHRNLKGSVQDCRASALLGPEEVDPRVAPRLKLSVCMMSRRRGASCCGVWRTRPGSAAPSCLSRPSRSVHTTPSAVHTAITGCGGSTARRLTRCGAAPCEHLAARLLMRSGCSLLLEVWQVVARVPACLWFVSQASGCVCGRAVNCLGVVCRLLECACKLAPAAALRCVPHAGRGVQALVAATPGCHGTVQSRPAAKSRAACLA